MIQSLHWMHFKDIHIYQIDQKTNLCLPVKKREANGSIGGKEEEREKLKNSEQVNGEVDTVEQAPALRNLSFMVEKVTSNTMLIVLSCLCIKNIFCILLLWLLHLRNKC